MGDTTKIGVEIDARLWEEFRNDVENRRGRVRGVLGDEVETALRSHLYAAEDGDALDHMKRIEEKLDAAIDAEADGGTTLSTGESARARESGKPPANSPREKKVRYLVDCVCDVYGVSRESGELIRDDVWRLVDREYSFEEATTEEYVGLVIEAFGAVSHPGHGNSLVWGTALSEAEAKVREAASEELEELSGEANE